MLNIVMRFKSQRKLKRSITKEPSEITAITRSGIVTKTISDVISKRNLYKKKSNDVHSFVSNKNNKESKYQVLA